MGKERQFETKKAVRKDLPILFGIFSPTGAGKTVSGLRIATGMQRVYGGRIVVVDTESRRASHHADAYDFDVIDMGPPYSPNDYLLACLAAKAKGAGVIMVDSGSHMHEGVGGLLEMHDAEVDRLSTVFATRQAANLPAWSEPKKEFQRVKDALLALKVPMVWCFRGKRKIKPAPRGSQNKQPIEQGWMPIISDELAFEMTLCGLLQPGSRGVPTWNPVEPESRARVKLPGQFEKYFLSKRGPFDEGDGEMVARWMKGEDVRAVAPSATRGTNGNAAKFAASKALDWTRAVDWGEKPLDTADLDTLLEYESAVRDAIERERDNGRRAKWEAHLRTVEQAIADREPGADEDEPGSADGAAPGEASAQ